MYGKLSVYSGESDSNDSLTSSLGTEVHRLLEQGRGDECSEPGSQVGEELTGDSDMNIKWLRSRQTSTYESQRNGLGSKAERGDFGVKSK